jgi:hypothetical protein
MFKITAFGDECQLRTWKIWGYNGKNQTEKPEVRASFSQGIAQFLVG